MGHRTNRTGRGERRLRQSSLSRATVGWDLNGVLADPNPLLARTILARWGVALDLPGRRYNEALETLVEQGRDRAQVGRWIRDVVNDPVFILELEPIPGSQAAWRRAEEAGFACRVVTGHSTEPETVRATEEWLARHGFFGRCDFARDKMSWSRQVRPALLVDDSPEKALAVAEAGTRVALVDRPYNAHVQHELVERVVLDDLFQEER